MSYLCPKPDMRRSGTRNYESMVMVGNEKAASGHRLFRRMSKAVYGVLKR
jgi:hypothetical protein